MAGKSIEEQLKPLVVVQESGKVVDSRLDNTKSAAKHQEKLKEQEDKKKRSDILKKLRGAKSELKELTVKRDELRKAGNAVRKVSMEECTRFYSEASALAPEILGMQKHIRSLQQKLER
jgi:mevalonate kinase